MAVIAYDSRIPDIGKYMLTHLLPDEKRSVEHRYSEDEPRDRKGEWTTVDGGSDVARHYSLGRTRTDEIYHGTSVARAKQMLKSGILPSTKLPGISDREYDNELVSGTQNKTDAAHFGQNAGADDPDYDKDHFAIVVVKKDGFKKDPRAMPSMKNFVAEKVPTKNIARVEIYPRYKDGKPVFSGKVKPEKVIIRKSEARSLAVDVERRYSEDEPRDDHGEWTAGGAVIRDVQKLNQNKAKVLLAERAGRVRIKDLISSERGNGHASRLLSGVTSAADTHGVTLELTASPYGDEKTRLDHDQLKAFYGRHGFVDEPGYDPALGYMIREPKGGKRYSEDEPRDDHGQWTAGGEAPLGTDYGDASKRDTEFSDQDYKDVAASMGQDPAKVVVSHDDSRTFKVGDREFKEAGHASLETGVITIYPAQAKNAAYGITAHEVAHVQYEKVMQAYHDEEKRWMADAHEEYKRVGSGSWNDDRQTWIASGHTLVQTPAGFYNPTPENDAKYPVLAELAKFQQAQDGQFQKDDGVTDYSKSYWTALTQPNSDVRWDSAMHETIAEIARLKATDPNNSKTVKPYWRKYYNAVSRVYKKLPK
jgi:hypothetical protein